jgi:16S rRNA (cytosine1402-N4)-methyltransferase
MADFATHFAQGYGGSKKVSSVKHKPVLLKETIEALDLEAREVFLDGTFGGGGHSREVLRHYPSVRIIGLDQDSEVSSKLEVRNSKLEVFTENFRNLDKVLTLLGIDGVDAILFDLGFSSDQMELSGRGFSFQRDEPLDMRMSKKGPTAADILNSWDESAIELILRGFGEEKDSKKIARAIVEERKIKPFKTTFDLVAIVKQAKPSRLYNKIHPATKTFQALRIAVNEELDALEEGLGKGFEALKPGGRFAIISFHSLEDRIVKNFFRDKIREGKAKGITKKPITPSEQEILENPRARSAKLRVIEKI